MKANNSMNQSVNVKSAINNVLKEEHKSLSSLLKSMKVKENSAEMKEFLNTYSLTFAELTDLNFFKSGLKMHTFKTSDGKEYETICRKNKEGEIVPAKWSFWLILTAASKVKRLQIAEVQKKQKEAKEASLKAIEKEEKETKKAAKK